MSGNHNEKLEFLGDSVISLVMSNYLYKKCKDEGELTMMRAKLVCKQTLAEFASALNLETRMKFGKGALNTNARNNEKVLEDAFEAYIGAVFLDSDENFLEVMDFMKPLLEPKVEKLLLEKNNAQQNDPSKPIIGPQDVPLMTLPLEDPINKLQTWSQRRSFGLPKYNLVENKEVENKEVEKKHIQPKFTFEVVINGITYPPGTARNKSEAKKLAATNALKLIDDTVKIIK
ncbi:8908_t:CDS:1 [Funneliformis geosporum]|uniref:8171_t:CDS:1 n=1 Tax=Funneliformis geosporum TaxID=1117311 RepID=A0A9W4SVE5_9GLOM|nr:8908_t:CDS:1 [Funneliformis geosporum]CAI2182765.1 8171_t:CDS:1 [Funneliformis geosporum]